MQKTLASTTLANGWQWELLQDIPGQHHLTKLYHFHLQGLSVGDFDLRYSTGAGDSLLRLFRELGEVLGSLPPTDLTAEAAEALRRRLNSSAQVVGLPEKITGLDYIMTTCVHPVQFPEGRNTKEYRPASSRVKEILQAWPEVQEEGITSLAQLTRLLGARSYLGARRAPYFQEETLAEVGTLLKLKEEAWEEVLRICLVWYSYHKTYKAPLEPTAVVRDLELPPLYQEGFHLVTWRYRSWNRGLNLRNRPLREKLASLTVEQLLQVFRELNLNSTVGKLLVQVDQTVASLAKQEAEVDPVAVGKLLTEALTLWPETKPYYSSEELPVISTFASLSKHPVLYKLLADGGIGAYCKEWGDFTHLVSLFCRHRATTWINNPSNVTPALKELAAVAPGRKIIPLIQEASRSKSKPLSVVEWANIGRQWKDNGYDDLPAAWILEMARGERKLTQA